MRSVIILLMVFIGVGCVTTKKGNRQHYTLNGTWIPTMQEIGGAALPGTMLEKELLVISDSNYTFSAESIDRGSLRYTRKKMDIYGKVGINAGRHIPAVYKLEQDKLTICYDLSGKGYPTAFETKGKPAQFLSVFKRAGGK